MPPPITPYSSITFGQAKQDLRLRLNSTGTDFWTLDELGIYLTEALRVWNCLTATYVAEYTQTFDPSSAVWQSLANGFNSLVGNNPDNPRYQTLTDSYVYTIAQLHLLEPPNGNSTWSGTPQFSLADFTQALQRRRDMILQLVGCNIGPFSATFGCPLGQSRVYLPDSTSQSILDIRRIRYIPTVDGNGNPLGPPSTLYREDGLAYEYFENDFTISSPDAPFAWDVLAGPPLAITLDVPANLPNTLDMLTMISGGVITPPTASPLLIPDDWNWVLKWGMMSDLLRKESESTDLERADFCEKRFQEGVQLMMEMPWLLQARVNNLPVDTPSVAEMDTFAYEWQSDVDAQLAIVRGGIDLFALSPNPQLFGVGYGDGGYGDGGYGGTGSQQISITLSLVANMPVPSADGDFLQISRDVYDSLLDYAEHIAMFKEGGFEFAESTRTLYKNFISTAVATNSRLRESGIFQTTLRPPNSRQDAADPRFATTGSGK